MELMRCSTTIALWRAVLFIADVSMCMILLVTVGLVLSILFNFDFTVPPIATWVLRVFEVSPNVGSLVYLIPIIGILWLYNRYLARKANSTYTEEMWNLGFTNTDYFFYIAVAAAVGVMIASMLSVSIWAGVTFLLGLAFSSGAGISLKARMTGLFSPKHQLVIALLTTVALLTGSWISESASFLLNEISIYGGIVAPVLGTIAGFFIRIKPGDFAMVGRNTAREENSVE
ncbi:TPA: hypothetical protein ACVU5D_004050 [Vibrio parahaemolyticus]|nr:hypothetical protein [Vibrio alginolyticus]